MYQELRTFEKHHEILLFHVLFSVIQDPFLCIKLAGVPTTFDDNSQK